MDLHRGLNRLQTAACLFRQPPIYVPAKHSRKDPSPSFWSVTTTPLACRLVLAAEECDMSFTIFFRNQIDINNKLQVDVFKQILYLLALWVKPRQKPLIKLSQFKERFILASIYFLLNSSVMYRRICDCSTLKYDPVLNACRLQTKEVLRTHQKVFFLSQRCC